MDKITGQTPVAPQTPLTQPTEEMLAQAIAEIAPLISADANVQVTRDGETKRVDDSKEKTVLAEIPELDEIVEEMIDLEADLEALLALLTAEQDEETIEATKKRIDSLLASIKQHHATIMKKVNETLDEMKKQEDSALASKILGWLGVVVSAIVAVAMIATVGGTAAAFAVLGAAIAITMQTLSETGVMDELSKAISESIKSDHPDWSKETCDMLAALSVAAIGIALSLVSIVGGGFASGGKGLLDVSQATMKTIRLTTLIASSTMTVANLSASTANSIINFLVQMDQADVTEAQGWLKELQAKLEQEQADIKELLQKLLDAFGEVIDLLQSKQDALNEISMNLEA